MNLYYRSVRGKGRGMFSKTKIKKNEVIEICPILYLPKKETNPIEKTMLKKYYYCWGKNWDEGALPLGYGLLYNHSYHSNANYKFDFRKKTITYFAVKDIPANTEITVNYNGKPDDETYFDI
ncbi:MAG TPA: SET domain-containing protein [Candidatus Magasanikbacteria bacterium]|nr:SET domain-containing protein [Candidatus Magasanikbacteria bacterium]